MTNELFTLDVWDYSYFAFLMIVGSAFHFAYQFLGKPFFAGLFFPTSESTFQHLKLLLLPSMIFFTMQFIAVENTNLGFFLSRFIGVLIGMLGICVFFYTYSGIVGDNFIVMDILSFAFGVICTVIAYRILDDSQILDFTYSNLFGVLGFALCTALFALLSVYPPQLGIFFDPVTNSYAPLEKG